MKTLIFTFYFLLSTFSLFAQTNFKVVNGALIWQKVYESPTSANVVGFVTQLAYSQSNGSIVTGNIKKSTVNYAAQGVKRIKMPIYMTEPFTAAVVIEGKPDRYRVTLNNICFYDPDDLNRNTAEGVTALGRYALKSSGEIRKSQLEALAIFDKDLIERFTINNPDW